MQFIEDIVDEVYEKNVYSESDTKKIFQDIESFKKKLQKELDKEGISADIFHGGSSAKGTFLKGDFDVDLFVRFNLKKYKEFSDKLSDILHLPLERATSGKFERLHGSRDYFQYRYTGDHFEIDFELVPVLDIKKFSEARNITDCSPLHVMWLKRMIAKNPGIPKNSVVMKLFLKSIGAYGAESYIKGFSGHVVDIMIAHHGSFRSLIEDSVNWEKHHLIDVQRYYGGKEDVLQNLDESKIAPLIVIDPVQPERNASAALSYEKFMLFKKKSKEFLENPRKSYFTLPKFSLAGLKKKDVPFCKRIVLKVTPLHTKKDIAGSKILKFYENLLRELKSNDFDVFDSGWAWPGSYAYVWVYITGNSISFVKSNSEIIREGPPLSKKIDVNKFKLKHEQCYEYEGKLYAKVKRKYKEFMPLIRNTIKEAKDKKYVVDVEFV